VVGLGGRLEIPIATGGTRCIVTIPRPHACVHVSQPRRAILKATDVCATGPERAARQLVEGGFAQNYDYALQVLTDLRYNAWRELDPEESLRFYACWLHEFGQLNSTPNAIIAEGTDWRFLNELKHELKA
jgi:NitT/TauT family transport system substrate-binding protein